MIDANSGDHLLNGPMQASTYLSEQSLGGNSAVNRWNEHYVAAASYYGNPDNYYRNFQYNPTSTSTANSATQFQSHPAFHPPAYSWLQAAVTEPNPSLNTNPAWSPRSNLTNTHLLNSTTSSLSSSSSSSSSSYPYANLNLPALNLSSGSASVSSSNVSSTATTPQSNNIINNLAIKLDSNIQTSNNLLKTPTALDMESNNNTFHSTPSANFDPRIHNQLVNAYQSYTQGYGNHLHQQTGNNYFYPSTPSKEMSNDLKLHSLIKGETNGSIGANSYVNEKVAATGEEHNRNAKKIKLEIEHHIIKRSIDLSRIAGEENFVEQGEDNEEELEDDESCDENDEEDDLENSMDNTSISPINHRNFSNENYWQLNPSGEQNGNESNYDTKDSSIKWSPNSSKNSNKKKPLPGNYQFFCQSHLITCTNSMDMKKKSFKHLYLW